MTADFFSPSLRLLELAVSSSAHHRELGQWQEDGPLVQIDYCHDANVAADSFQSIDLIRFKERTGAS